MAWYEFLKILQESSWFFYLLAGIFGLIVGSFLNVVIYRLPKMIEYSWRAHCQEMFNSQEIGKNDGHGNLFWPGSYCPICRNPISPLENIPIFSYILLRGKCKHCKTPISIRYPVVELASALLTLLVAWQFGPTGQFIAVMIFSWAMLALSVIDLDTYLLPDDITQPLLWLGLVCNLFGWFTDLPSAVIGAIVGYLSLWSIFHIFKLVTGKEGMGYGDFKLFAVFGAWMGWQALPLIILLSSVVGAIIGTVFLLARNKDRDTPIPFGPFLAGAGWLALVWQNEIMSAYTNVILG